MRLYVGLRALRSVVALRLPVDLRWCLTFYAHATFAVTPRYGYVYTRTFTRQFTFAH